MSNTLSKKDQTKDIISFEEPGNDDNNGTSVSIQIRQISNGYIKRSNIHGYKDEEERKWFNYSIEEYFEVLPEPLEQLIKANTKETKELIDTFI